MLEEDSRRWILTRGQMPGSSEASSNCISTNRSSGHVTSTVESLGDKELLTLAISSYSPPPLVSKSAPVTQPIPRLRAISDTWLRNKWEIDRLLAARDCIGLGASSGISDSDRFNAERWLVALRLPRDTSLLLTQRGGGRVPVMTLGGNAVLRARSALALMVHPDKCDPADAKRASEAFSFLQVATAGLLAIIGSPS